MLVYKIYLALDNKQKGLEKLKKAEKSILKYYG